MVDFSDDIVPREEREAADTLTYAELVEYLERLARDRDPPVDE